jgi:hypothetical protein
MDSVNEMMKSMRETNPKYLKRTFFEIAQMENSQNVTINIPKLKCINIPATLVKDSNGYYLQFESNTSFQDNFKLLFDIEIKLNNGTIYNAIDASFSKLQFHFEDLSKLAFTYTVKINKIKLGPDFTTNYYRMVLKMPSNVSVMHPFFLPVQGFSSENSFSLGLLNINFADLDYDVFETKESETKYIVLDSKKIVSYDDFYNQTLSILVSLGFYTTHFIQNECYVIESSVPDYTQIVAIGYKTLRKSVRLQFNFLGFNPFDYFDRNDAQKHQGEMPSVSQECLNKLVEIVYTNPTIQNCLFVFIVANDNPLDTQPACVSVALEGLCNTVMEDNKDKTNPIKDKTISKDIKDKLLAILNEYKDKIDSDGYRILSIKIDTINSPTNRDKLVKPFELMGLKLKPYEITAIDNRNNFLHGRLEVKIGKNILNKDSQLYQLNFTSAVLRKLFSILLLKYAGYSGSIINNIKVNENIFGPQPDEHIIEKI